MRCNILSTLATQFSAAIECEETSNIHIASLQIYLKNFPKEIDLVDIPKSVSLFFHTQWIRSSIRGHKQRVRQSLHKLENGDVAAAKKELLLAQLWIGQAQKIYETIIFYTEFSIHNIDQYIMDAHDLHTGDIVLSYKTNSYLRKSLTSRLVKYACNSAITHAMIVSNLPHEDPELLLSGDTTHGLGTTKVNPDRGEIFIVFESRDPNVQKSILTSIALWRTRALNRIRYDVSDTYLFPEFKCQLASLIGVCTVIFGYLSLPFTVRNFAEKQQGVFCSELIDTIYKESQVLLSPRSEHNAIIGPVELFYSPILRIRGIIASKEDVTNLESEIYKFFRKK